MNESIEAGNANEQEATVSAEKYLQFCARHLLETEKEYYRAAYQLAAANALLRDDQAASETGDPITDKENKIFSDFATAESQKLPDIVKELHVDRVAANEAYRKACIDKQEIDHDTN